MTAPTSPRPQVALIQAAIKHLQESIRELMRAEAAAERLYDERDIDEAPDALDDKCPVCGGSACACDVVELLAQREAIQDSSPAAAELAEPRAVS